ncbi:SigB/SigF/SigG family RNA polymerase sigma factor [Mycobacterium deserti]|uniref:SigB/SigF/SigG family RNA polymerase sigma factor n=1 Tax=Mycobacterium deserti TaxID=2978347 RepID=A0ABT2MGJ6_9MYCO|nr:SigB/SigF/SigG family RNA polymerase sigma factor [Mycobacterium deserti]MCT7661414.1 SigB/SigF/SigG family RNA polymerase sigma factor [Mycobacterium deserti]
MTTATTATLERRDYGDVLEMFRELSQSPLGSNDYLRRRERIIRHCLPLAEHIARRYGGRGEPHDDLLQTARLGLLNAVERFDCESGSDFLAFAVPTIMGEVKRYFRDNGWSVHVPRRLKEGRAAVTAATAELSQRLNRAPTPSELARELGVERSEVVEGLIAAQCYQTRSLDAPAAGAGSEDGMSVCDRLGAVDPGMDVVEFREAVRPLIAALPQRERDIIVMRFFEGMTQTQIAHRLGVSQMHISRLLAKTLGQLRAGLD